MKNGSGLTFILLASTVLFTAMLIQSYMRPKAVDDPALQQDGKQDVAQVDPGAIADGELKASVDGEQQASTDDEDSPETPAAAETARVTSDEFVQMGSLDPSGADRFLVTVNKRAGTIHRVELNYRYKKSGKYKYRDLVWKGGYLGALACLDTPEGCQVRLAGKGTPAQLAGIEVGDIIVSIDGEPVIDAAGFEEYLNEKTKPKTDVAIVVNRNGAQQTFTVSLTQKPISIIRPEPMQLDPTFKGPESFVFSLIKPMQDVDKAWPDLDSGMRTANWEVTSSNDDMIELKFDLSPKQLEEIGISGPLTVFKRFRMPAIAPEDIHELDSRSFNLELELEVENGSDVAHELAYELDGPTGLTAETWWYANKIHGRQTAVGYMAGARDVVGSTAANSYIFLGNPELVAGAKKTSPAYSYICKPLSKEEQLLVNFLGVDSHYFNVSLLPKNEDGSPFSVNSVTAYPNNINGRIPKLAKKNARLERLIDCTFQMVSEIEVPANGSAKKTFEIFCGPKEPKVLSHYGLSDVRTFGWFSWCSMVLLWLLHLFYNLTFQFSYGLAIVMLTILVRCCMIPFSRKAALNAQMMQHLAPQMKEITEKYKEDMEKRAAAQRELYKKHNFNPFGGCFMMFFQLPIFYGLYKGLNVDIALRDKALIPGMEWCSNLAAPDKLMYWKDWMPSYLADETGWLGPFLNILPLLTMVLFIMQQKLFTPPPTDDQQKLMQKMMTFMMVAMGVMFFKVPAGLCLYFITSSLWGIIERKLLPKPVLNTDKLALATGDAKPAETRADKRAIKNQLREEQQREAERDEQRKRNADRKKRLKKKGKGNS